MEEKKNSNIQESIRKKNSKQIRHPLEESDLISSFFFFWINKALKKHRHLKSENRVWTQDTHYALPQADRIQFNFNKISLSYFNQKRKKNSLLLALIKAYFWQILGCLFLSSSYSLINFSTAYSTSQIVSEIESSKKDFRTWKGIERLVYYIVMLIIALFGSIVIFNYAKFYTYRLSYCCRSSVMTMIFEKSLKRNNSNPSKHDEGKIINYIQVDCMRFNTSLWSLINLVQLSASLVLGTIYVWYLLGNAIIVMLGSFAISTILLLILYVFRVIFVKRLLEAKDDRMGLLKNIIKNIKYVKMRAWENFYHYKLFMSRENEIKQLRNVAFYSAFGSFFVWLSKSLALNSILIYKSYINLSIFGFQKISAFMRIFDVMRDILLTLPNTVTDIIDLIVSINRIQNFLQSDEIEFDWIENIDQQNFESVKRQKITLYLQNGNFEWNKMEYSKKPIRKREAKESKENEKTSVGRETMLTVVSQTMKNESAQLKQSLIQDDINQTTIDKEGHISFRLQNINLKINKGELIFVMGKVGSGKSSLLYALLGEMKLSRTPNSTDRCDIKSKEVRLSREGQSVFLSETPWLMPNTIKENILLGKPWDPQRAINAIKMSQFDYDLKLMPKGLDTEIGEDGQTLSGGQRTRLALARCIYQE